MNLKEKLIDIFNKKFDTDFTDEQYDYERALYENMLAKKEGRPALAENIAIQQHYEQVGNPVDVFDIREEVKVLVEKKKDNAILRTRFVKPNRHVGTDIFSHFFTGCYEHQDENGNWVEGPALGHGYHGGYDDYCKEHPSKIDKALKSIKTHIEEFTIEDFKTWLNK